MKKFLMIFAMAASMMMVSCGDKKAGGAAEGSAAAEEQVKGDTVQLALQSAKPFGRYYRQMTPTRDGFAFVVVGEEGDSVAVEVTVNMMAQEAKDVKALKSAGVEFYYIKLGESSGSDAPAAVLQLDPSQYDAAVALAKAGVKDDYKPFKYVGKVAKAVLDDMKKSQNVFLKTTEAEFEE